MDKLDVHRKKSLPFEDKTTGSSFSSESKCEICGRTILKGEWVSKNLLANTIICEDCGEGIHSESFFSLD